MKTKIEIQPTETNPIVVDDYPYGFRLRTQIRYWVESKKNKGDRFVSQTLNPRTNKWNKPKKGTYMAICIVCRNEKDHITYQGLSFSTDVEAYNKFVEFVGTTKLNDIQKENLKVVYAYSKAYENVTFECRAVEYRNKETGEIVTSVPLMEMSDYEKVPTPEKDKEQAEAKEQINQAIGYYYNNAPIAS